jgi:carbon monoxide dehydrogenase subunit G
MADYHYVSSWQLQAPIEQVWAALNDLEHLPVWYRGVQEARELVPGDARGVGRRVRYVIKGRLPLRLAFEATTTRSDPPRQQDLQAQGELAGTGRWSLDQQGEVTTVRYHWDVHTIRPWMNLLLHWRGRSSPGTAEGCCWRPVRAWPAAWASHWWLLSSPPHPGRGCSGWAGRPWPYWGCGCWAAGSGQSDLADQVLGGLARPERPCIGEASPPRRRT